MAEISTENELDSTLVLNDTPTIENIETSEVDNELAQEMESES
jgi:hypothetical protein